jgi:hypothetical protein
MRRLNTQEPAHFDARRCGEAERRATRPLHIIQHPILEQDSIAGQVDEFDPFIVPLEGESQHLIQA